MRTRPERTSSQMWWTQSRARISSAQHAAGFLRHLGYDLRGDRLDLLVGQRLVARLQCDGDGDGLLGRIDALAFVDVEHGDIGNQLPVGALRRADDVAGLCAAIDNEGEIA